MSEWNGDWSQEWSEVNGYSVVKKYAAAQDLSLDASAYFKHGLSKSNKYLFAERNVCVQRNGMNGAG